MEAGEDVRSRSSGGAAGAGYCLPLDAVEIGTLPAT